MWTHILTPWSRPFLETLIVHQLVEKFPAFCRCLRSLLCSQVPAPCPYSEPHQSSLHPPWPISTRSTWILSYHVCQGFQSISFHHVSPPVPCMHLTSPPYMPHVPITLFFTFTSFSIVTLYLKKHMENILVNVSDFSFVKMWNHCNNLICHTLFFFILLPK
jgi:hypothetical protein